MHQSRFYVSLHSLLFFLLLPAVVGAQQTLETDPNIRTDIYDRSINPVPVFRLVQNSIVMTITEGRQKMERFPIHLPQLEGPGDTGYCFLYFGGNNTSVTKGYVPVLVHNVSKRQSNTELYVDHNMNLDFSDDGPPTLFPVQQQELTVCLHNPADTLAQLCYRLTRFSYASRDKYRDMLEDFFHAQTKERSFAGLRFSFREQRMNSRGLIWQNAADTFLLGLVDANNNGIYNEEGIDRISLTAPTDQFTIPMDVNYGSALLGSLKTMVLECHKRQLVVLALDKYGRSITLKEIMNPVLQSELKIGSKVPKAVFKLWNDENLKLKKLRRKQVYLYFTRFSYEGFKADTAVLIHLQKQYGKKLKIVYLLYGETPNKLRILAGFPNVNWYMAYTDRKTNAAFCVNEFPSGILLGKKRKVKAIGLLPAQVEKHLTR